MKKFFISAAFALLSVGAFAQNVQLHYDFGHNAYNKGDKDLSTRAYLTTTVEMFKPDSFGSTFFFVDMDYLSRNNPGGTTRGVVGAYWEIARELCFWQGTKMDWLSVHVEYNGGLNVTGSKFYNEKGGEETGLKGLSFNNAFLAGLTYSGHSKDFRRTWSLSAMYKLIPKTINAAGNKDYHNFQITGVWGINFAKDWCTFSGFVDFWREARPWQGTKYILLTEPQFWVNFNQIKGWENVHLSLGTEVEMSVNFAGKGFYAIPTLAAKWTF